MSEKVKTLEELEKEVFEDLQKEKTLIFFRKIKKIVL